MIIGPLYLSFAYPLFVYLASAFILVLWHLVVKSKSKRTFLPHSHISVTQTQKRKRVLYAQRIIFAMAVMSVIAMSFSAFDPQIVKTGKESVNARRIAVVCDISGSMVIGVNEDGYNLPEADKTRLGQAGKFMHEFAEKRAGDAFAFICFSTESYVARDFTTDTSQIKEFLSPADLVGILKNFQNGGIPESLRIKERAMHEGTWSAGGMKQAVEFIESHQDYTGEEILIYLGDLEESGGKINEYFVRELSKIEQEKGFEIYAVVVARDYDVSEKDRGTAELVAQKKISAFDNTGIPAYITDEPDDISRIAEEIANDIPKAKVEEEIMERYSLAPWALIAAFALMLAAFVLNEAFPKIP